jgi:hypothetical protein
MYTDTVAAVMAASCLPPTLAPWWARVVVGLVLVLVGILLNLALRTNLLSFGEFYNEGFQYLTLVLVIGGVLVVLWGLGVDFSS